MPCRINKRNEWYVRIYLEMMMWPHSTFVTLTYDDEHLPKDNLINKRDIQLFFKRLRKYAHLRQPGTKLRYFVCGEYGEKGGRPHYHGIIFGKFVDKFVEDAWQNGFVVCKDATPEMARYTAKYVTKGSKGRETWALMSRRPGLGLSGLPLIAKALKKYPECYDEWDEPMSRVPYAIRLDGGWWPLDRYCRERLAELLGEPRREAGSVGSWVANMKVEWFIRKGDPQSAERKASLARANKMASMMREKETL